MNRQKWLRAAEFLLLIVLGAALLVSASGNVCHKSIQRFKESVLKRDLLVMRMAIAEYTNSEQNPPQSLRDLVDKGYLLGIPANSFTLKKDWMPTFSSVSIGSGKTAFGIDYVYSSSTDTDSEGRPRAN